MKNSEALYTSSRISSALRGLKEGIVSLLWLKSVYFYDFLDDMLKGGARRGRGILAFNSLNFLYFSVVELGRWHFSISENRVIEFSSSPALRM